MSTSSAISLGSLRLQAQEMSDNENNPAVSTEAWNSFITNSYKSLYDMLIAAYGNDYYVANTYQFSLTGAQSYALPDGSGSFQDSTGATATKFYKLLGVDLQYPASPTGWVTLTRFEFIERNKYAYPNVAVNSPGYTNLRYRLEGNNLFVVPVPMTGQLARIWYAPAPTNLQFRLPGYTVSGSAVVGSMTDTTGVLVGMNVTGLGIPNSTVLSTSTTTMTLSNNASSAVNASILSIWSDGTLIEGIAGWEEYVIVDAAIKAQGKQEQDATALFAMRTDLKTRIEAMAEGRDAGQAHHVSDVLGANGSYDGWSDGGSGFGY